MGTVRIRRWKFLNDATQSLPTISNDYDPSGYQNYTPGISGIPAYSNNAATYRREGPDMIIKGTFLKTSSSVTADEIRIGLPSGYSSVSAIGNSTGLDRDLAGEGWIDFGGHYPNFHTMIEPSKSYFVIAMPTAVDNATTKSLGNRIFWSGGCVLEYYARIPISGWEV